MNFQVPTMEQAAEKYQRAYTCYLEQARNLTVQKDAAEQEKQRLEKQKDDLQNNLQEIIVKIAKEQVVHNNNNGESFLHMLVGIRTRHWLPPNWLIAQEVLADLDLTAEQQRHQENEVHRLKQEIRVKNQWARLVLEFFEVLEEFEGLGLVVDTTELQVDADVLQED